MKSAYNTYKRTLRPIERVHLPPPQLIYVMPAFRDLIYTKLDKQLDQVTCDAAAERLPQWISAFMDALKRHLLKDIADADALRSPGRKAKRESNGKLALATSVFRGPDQTTNLHSFGDVAAYLSSLEMLGNWDSEAYIFLLETRRWGPWNRLCSYDDPESRVAEALVTAHGLDPATARPEDLDEMGRQFVCENCTGLDVRAYSWRRFVSHWLHFGLHDLLTDVHLRTQVPHHCAAHRWRDPRIRVLSEGESAAVRHAQGADPAAQQSMWSCNHCSAHLENLQMRQVVATHVQET